LLRGLDQPVLDLHQRQLGIWARRSSATCWHCWKGFAVTVTKVFKESL